jgi:hypothetical protein
VASLIAAVEARVSLDWDSLLKETALTEKELAVALHMMLKRLRDPKAKVSAYLPDPDMSDASRYSREEDRECTASYALIYHDLFDHLSQNAVLPHVEYAHCPNRT